MTAEDVLARAADILEQKGWVQSCWRDADGRCCILGALEGADRDIRHWLKVKRAVSQELGFSDYSGDSLINWNNAPDRTAEEVITTLRNAKRWL